MARKSRVYLLTFPVFCDYVVHVEFTSDLKNAVLKYPQTKPVPIDNTDALSVHVKGETFSFIFFKPNASAGTVAHESWHVVRRMLDYMGVDLDNETVAYHLGYLVNEIIKVQRGRS